MFILSRKLGERVIINDEFVVTVVKIDQNQIRLGFEGPANATIYREEIHPKRRAEDAVAGEALATASAAGSERGAHASIGVGGGRTYPAARRLAGPTKDHVEGPASPSAADLLVAAEGLDAGELEGLVQGLLALRARRVAPVASAAESELLLRINRGLPADVRSRLDALVAKLEDEALSGEERDELLRLTDEAQRLEVDRLESLAQLAAVRGTTLSELMRAMGVGTPGHG